MKEVGKKKKTKTLENKEKRGKRKSPQKFVQSKEETERKKMERE